MGNKKIPIEKKKIQLQIGIEKYKIDAIGIEVAQENCKEFLDKVYKKSIRKS